MKTCLLHRYPKEDIKQTNAAFPYLEGVVVKTYKRFNRLNSITKLLKSLAWIFYAPLLVIGRGYDVIYCDDSFPYYAGLVKLVSPNSKVIKRMGDLHLMYYVNGIWYKILHFFEKIEWNLMDRILAISTTMDEYISNETTTSVETIFDPIDPKDFEVEPLPHKGKRVMWHGLITKNKGLDVILEVAKILPGIDFWILGDGPDRLRLQQIAPYNVYFAGWKPFKLIPYFIDMCDIGLCIRSDNPGNEFVVTSPFLQYSVMGKPCIVSRRKVFEDYPWQFSNPQELTNMIRYLLDNPEEGEKSRQFVLKHHNAETIGKQIMEVLCGI